MPRLGDSSRLGGVELCVGPNWTVNAPEAAVVADYLGGTLVSTLE